jgi:protein-tyrosine phosphatase
MPSHSHVLDVSGASGIRSATIFRTGWTMMSACPFGYGRQIEGAQLIDLRSSTELERSDDGVARTRVPIDRPGVAARIGHCPGDDEYAAVYTDMVRHCGMQVAEVFTELARAQPRPVVIGCSLGKDRTGLVVAVLMRFLGIATAQVLESERDARFAIQRCEPALTDYAQRLGTSVAELRRRCMLGTAALVGALNLVDDEYGGPSSYLTAHGASPATLSAVLDWLRPPGGRARGQPDDRSPNG